MNNKFVRSTAVQKLSRCEGLRGLLPALLFWAGFISLGIGPHLRAQNAFIADAWWTFQQDCNGDGCKAGTLAGNLARLNWEPDVTNCNGTLTVYEQVYWAPCGTANWTAVYTNAPHDISGCRSLGQQYLDIQMGSACECWDYKIEIYRPGQSTPDHVRSPANDADLSRHYEQQLAQDFCLSDIFATCVSLNGAAGNESDSSVNATKEPGEPNHAGNPGGHSLWYCWTAPTNTVVTFDTIGSTFDTVLAVYTGNSVSNLTLVASNDDIAGATNRQSSVSFTPVTGLTYHIAVDGYGGAAGVVTLNWNQAAQALPNLIIWGPATSPTVISRTFAPGDCEVVEGCATVGQHRLLSFNMETRNIGTGDLIIGDPHTNSLFVWASCHGHFHFEQFAEYNLLDTNGNLAATGHKVGFCVMDVHAWGQPGAATGSHFDCNNQGIQHGWADVYSANLPCQYIDVSAVPPGKYILQLILNPDSLFLESRYDDNTAYVAVNIPPADCSGGTPPNDSFANAIVVTNFPFTFTEFNSCASKQGSEPNHAGDFGGHSVWFNWTPAFSQTAVINSKRSDFDTMLAVYTGNTVSSLSVVASNDDIVSNIYRQSQVTFSAIAGTTYHIAIDGWQGAVGSVTLNVQPPGNDDFSTQYLISGTFGTTNGSTIATSKQPGEPAHASDVGGHSIWYRWTAPSDGPVSFTTLGSTFDTTLAVYTGSILTNLAVVASNDDDPQAAGNLYSRLWFYAIAGTSYRIAIDGFGGVAGATTLSWNMENRLGIARLPNGSTLITMTGVDSQRYTLQGSSNFTTWTTNFPTMTMSGGSLQFTNPPPGIGNLPNVQVFRARLEP